MKTLVSGFLFLVLTLSVFSCATKPEVRPAEPSQAPLPPPADVFSAVSRAEAAAAKCESSVGKCDAAAARAESEARRAEEAANRVRLTAMEARDSAERAERAARRLEDWANQARLAAERAERAARRVEELLAMKPATVPEKVEPLPLAPPPAIRTQEAEWRFEKQAIRLRFKSDPQLNLYQRTSHTLVLCVYHLKDPNAFNQLLEEKEGLWKLLECGRFDPSVTYAKRVVVQPGKDLTEVMDRPEGARYVSIVAGYYTLQKERVSRIFPIPVVSEKKGDTIFLRPGVLDINLYLGPQEIQDMK